jgi:hypothetical protein
VRKLLSLASLALLCLGAPAVFAQDCDESTTVGNFRIDFEGTSFDGDNTRFDYCITGLDGPDFHALSDWLLSLNTDCIGESDIVSCGPDPCFYQADDPHFGLTGIKFDDLDTEVGETDCFHFTLAGNWTNLVGETTLGVKAATAVWSGDICGPICEACHATLQVRIRTGAQPQYLLSLQHNRAVTVTTEITYHLLDAKGVRLRTWTEGPVTLVQGQSYTSQKDIPGAALPSGHYTLRMRMAGMNGWVTKLAQFDVP